MEHRFTGPAYTLGIEEELMILDEETLDLSNSIETVLAALPPVEGEPQVKEELMESVVEIMTTPSGSMHDVSEQLHGLRRQVQATARECGLAIASAGTHPFALWEEQRIVARPRYRALVSQLRWVARQEVIFGVHVHVGIDDPDKAIHVANGMRVHLPLLLALSANSPFWRADQTGLLSTRTPIFRAFPRVGIPPRAGPGRRGRPPRRPAGTRARRPPRPRTTPGASRAPPRPRGSRPRRSPGARAAGRAGRPRSGRPGARWRDRGA